MPLVIPPGFASAAFILDGPVGTGPFVTTIGVVAPSAAPAALNQLANDLFNQYANTILSLTSDELQLQRVDVTVSLGPGQTGSVSFSLNPEQGTNPDLMGPVAMSVIARKFTNRLGRKGRGRMLIPGLASEIRVDEGGFIPSATAVNINVTLELFLFGEVGGTSPVKVLLHSDATPPDPIQALIVAPQVGWVRKRIR